MQIILMSIKNILRRRTASFITFLSIFIGIFCIVLINKISVSAKLEIDKQLNLMGAGCINIKSSANKGASKVLLTSKDIFAVKNKFSSLDLISPLMLNYGSVKCGNVERESVIIGVDGSAADIFSVSFTFGEMFDKKSLTKSGDICVVDNSVISELPVPRNKKITLNLAGKKRTFKINGAIDYKSRMVDGIMGDESPLFVFIPYTTMQEMTGAGGFDRITLRYKNNAESESESKKIVEYLNMQKSTNTFTKETLDSEKAAVDGIVDIFALVLSLIGGISLIIAGFNVMSLMLSNVTERTREIGIKKALGAKNSHILVEFLAESVIISFIGGFAGSVCASFIFNYAAFRMNISSGSNSEIFISTIFAVILGAVFGAVPSIKAARLEPIKALEGTQQ